MNFVLDQKNELHIFYELMIKIVTMVVGDVGKSSQNTKTKTKTNKWFQLETVEYETLKWIRSDLLLFEKEKEKEKEKEIHIELTQADRVIERWNLMSSFGKNNEINYKKQYKNLCLSIRVLYSFLLLRKPFRSQNLKLRLFFSRDEDADPSCGLMTANPLAFQLYGSKGDLRFGSFVLFVSCLYSNDLLKETQNKQADKEEYESKINEPLNYQADYIPHVNPNPTPSSITTPIAISSFSFPSSITTVSSSPNSFTPFSALTRDLFISSSSLSCSSYSPSSLSCSLFEDPRAGFLSYSSDEGGKTKEKNQEEQDREIADLFELMNHPSLNASFRNERRRSQLTSVPMFISKFHLEIAPYLHVE